MFQWWWLQPCLCLSVVYRCPEACTLWQFTKLYSKFINRLVALVTIRMRTSEYVLKEGFFLPAERAEGLDCFADIISNCDLEILCVECDVRLHGKFIR
jgi:hypothetical protein